MPLEGYIALLIRLKAYGLDTKLEKEFETDITLRVQAAFAEDGIHPPALLHRNVKSKHDH